MEAREKSVSSESSGERSAADAIAEESAPEEAEESRSEVGRIKENSENPTAEGVDDNAGEANREEVLSLGSRQRAGEVGFDVGNGLR